MAQAPARLDYYPGSNDRVAVALDRYPQAEIFGSCTLLTGITPDRDEDALHNEYFAPVLGVIEIPGTAAEFLSNAVQVCNEEIEGTLGVNIIAAPHTITELGAHFDDAVAQLRYGTVAINAWTAVGYLTARASWGAFPGHSLTDIQSGTGVVHNALLLDDVERTIVRGPFRPAPRSLAHGEFTLSPKPPWFITNRAAATTMRRLTGFAAEPGLSLLPAIFGSALRG